MSRYTFAVCVSCGVQSQPIIVDEMFTGIYDALERMDWEFYKFKYDGIIAYCPQCKDAKKQAV